MRYIVSGVTSRLTCYRSDALVGMKWKLMGVGSVLSLVGIVLAAELSLAGPTFPTTPLGLVGWALLLAGLAGMRLSLGDGQ